MNELDRDPSPMGVFYRRIRAEFQASGPGIRLSAEQAEWAAMVAVKALRDPLLLNPEARTCPDCHSLILPNHNAEVKTTSPPLYLFKCSCGFSKYMRLPVPGEVA